MPYKRPRLLDPETPDSMGAPRRRRRAAVSCVTCRERRVACDRKDPCNYCANNSIRCQYKSFQGESLRPPPPPPPPPPQRAAAEPPTEPEPAPAAVTPPSLTQQDRPFSPQDPVVPRSAPLFRNPAPAPTPASAAVLLSSNAPPLTLLSDPRENLDPGNASNEHHGLRHQLQRVPMPQSSPATARRYGLDDTGWSILKHRLGLRDSDVVFNKTRIPRWSEWMGTAPEFSSVHACFTAASSGDMHRLLPRSDLEPLIAEMRDYLQKTRVITKNIKSSGIAKFSSISVNKLTPPSRDTADTMVALYFEHFESTHRVLHIPTFYSDYEKYWSAPNEASEKLRLKVLLVVAIGTSLHASFDTDTKLREQVYQWVYAAGEWLSLPWEKPRMDVEGVQVQCLAYFARQVFATGGDAVWEAMGTLINTAKQVNLHRDPKYLPKMSVLEAEVRRRLWYTILELEMHTALDTAMAVRLSTADFDTEAPSNIKDSELDEASPVLPSHDNTAYTETSLQLLLLSTAPLRLRMLTILNGLHSKFSYTDVLSLSQELIATHTEMIRLVHHKRPRISAFKRNLVEFLVRRYLLPLHCPFASLAQTNPLFHYSKEVSIDTAVTLICPESNPAYNRLLKLGGNFLREGLRCAATGLCSELIAQTNTKRSQFTHHQAGHMADTLKKALKEVIQLSAEQVKRCDRNVKLHMFLSMVRAHVKSGQKTQVARAGRDSLAFCYDLLQTSYGMAASPVPESSDEQVPESLGGSGAVDVDDFNLDWDFAFFVPDTGYFRQFT